MSWLFLPQLVGKSHYETPNFVEGGAAAPARPVQESIYEPAKARLPAGARPAAQKPAPSAVNDAASTPPSQFRRALRGFATLLAPCGVALGSAVQVLASHTQLIACAACLWVVFGSIASTFLGAALLGLYTYVFVAWVCNICRPLGMALAEVSAKAREAS